MKIIQSNGCIVDDFSIPETVVMENLDEYELQRKCNNKNCVNQRHFSFKLIRDQGIEMLGETRESFDRRRPEERKAYFQHLKEHPEILWNYRQEGYSINKTADALNVSRSFVLRFFQKAKKEGLC